jgi:endonuclease III
MTPRARAGQQSKLATIVAALRAHYGAQAPPPASNAFELVLWEMVAYLATDARRAEAFAALRERVGLAPNDVLHADDDVLCEVASIGGKVAVADRAARMRDVAAIVLDEPGGSLDAALSLPLREAKRSLRRFHGIGEPGAEKILLLTRTHRLLALDSNGARALVRIGYGVDNRSYAAMYKSVSDAVRPELVDDFDWLIGAHLLLRRHGQETCKSSAPRCEMCPVRSYCAYGQGGREAVTA